jgi:hypothetical protein
MKVISLQIAEIIPVVHTMCTFHHLLNMKSETFFLFGAAVKNVIHVLAVLIINK